MLVRTSRSTALPRKLFFVDCCFASSVTDVRYVLISDPAIRTELMDHVPHIAMLCHSEKEKLLYVVDHLLPLVAKQLTDPDTQVASCSLALCLCALGLFLQGAVFSKIVFLCRSGKQLKSHFLC